MCGSNRQSHFYHKCVVSLTSGRPVGHFVPKRCVCRSMGSEKCGKGSSVVVVVVCLWICVFYLGRGALTLYLYFLQVDTWEEINLFNYLPLALYKSIFLFFCCFMGLFDVFGIFIFLVLYYNYYSRL